VSNTQIYNRIISFDRWHYQFEIGGYKTPIFQTDHINRHKQRKRYFFDPLVSLLGGSLEGKRILDLGCNAGFWSLCAIESGCDYVYGIDGRQMHIDQANFIFEVKGINKNRYFFKCGNVFDILNKDIGEFDVVFCLGLLYHISKPVTLLENISNINTDLILIDTLHSRRVGSIYEIRKESLEEPRNAIDYELVFIPTIAAVFDLVHQFGYCSVMLTPNFTDYTGASDYRNGLRRAFICSKRTDLTNINIDTITPIEFYQNSKNAMYNYLLDIPTRNLAIAIIKKVIRRLGFLSLRS